MPKDIFTKEQEDQIRKAFDRIDDELGLYKLDDDRDLERIFSKVQETSSSQSWLSKRLHEVEEKLTKLTHAIEVLLEQNSADMVNSVNQQFDAIRTPAVFRRESASVTYHAMERDGSETYDIPAFLRRQTNEIAQKDSPSSTAKYSINDPKASTADSSINDDLRLMGDKLMELNLAMEKKQEESIRFTESILGKLSHDFEEKLNRLMLALEKQEELLRIAYAAFSKNSDAIAEDLVKPAIESSPRKIIQSQKQKHERNRFSYLGDILASPTYAFASMLLIVSLGLAIGFQASELNTLKHVEDPLRGGKEIFQIVENPLVAAQSFADELISQDIPYQMDFESKDKIKIKIPVNEKTTLLMSAKRIELPQESQCILVFEKTK